MPEKTSVGFGPIEKLIAMHGSLSAIAGLLVVYLPQITGLFDFGQYAPVVTVLVAGAVSLLKLYVTNNQPKVEAAVKEQKKMDAQQ